MLSWTSFNRGSIKGLKKVPLVPIFVAYAAKDRPIIEITLTNVINMAALFFLAPVKAF